MKYPHVSNNTFVIARLDSDYTPRLGFIKERVGWDMVRLKIFFNGRHLFAGTDQSSHFWSLPSMNHSG